jgi:phage terminase large subunit GpA-like protein
MIKVVCRTCKEEKGKYEIVNLSVDQRRYEVRCPDCGKTFVVYGQNMEGQPHAPPDHEENPEM